MVCCRATARVTRMSDGMLFWTTLEIIKHVLYFQSQKLNFDGKRQDEKDFEEYITHHTTQAY